MYTILQASELTGVSRDMIRHYEKIGLIRAERMENGYRAYSDAHLYRLVMIRYLSNLGIGLKRIKTALYENDVSGLIDGLREESVRLQLMRAQIEAGLAAADVSLNSFEQYAQRRTHTVLNGHPRRLYSREAHDEEEYYGVCRSIAESGSFFQYYYCQSVVLKDGELSIEHADSGIMIYEPMLVELEDTKPLFPKQLYQSTQSMKRGQLMREDELKTHALRAHALSRKNRMDIYSYQIFEAGMVNEECVVCLEIPLD